MHSRPEDGAGTFEALDDAAVDVIIASDTTI
jgi:hypothetical protein